MANKLLPNRAIFFRSSSISSVIVTAPSDIFVAVLSIPRNDIVQMFSNKPQEKQTAVFLPYNTFSPVVKETSRKLKSACPIYEKQLTSNAVAGFRSTNEKIEFSARHFAKWRQGPKVLSVLFLVYFNRKTSLLPLLKLLKFPHFHL